MSSLVSTFSASVAADLRFSASFDDIPISTEYLNKCVATGETRTIFIDLMDIVANPRVIAHVPQDHRYVTPQELKTVSPYNVIMNKPNTSIMDYAMDKPELFLSLDGTAYYSLSIFVS